MSYDADTWESLFPATIGNETRPTDAIDNTLVFATDKFPQFISSDPVKYTLQNAFLKQLFSNDQRIKEITDNIKSGYLPLTGGTMTGAITLPSDPTADLQATTKKYVDTADRTKLSLSGGTMTGAITLPSDPTADLQATTKKYVDMADGIKLSLSGGTMTGAITLPSDPTADLQAATKKYVDTADGTKLSLSGGTMTGAITLPSDPTTDLQAATKKYVDTMKQDGFSVNAIGNGGHLTFPAWLGGLTIEWGDTGDNYYGGTIVFPKPFTEVFQVYVVTGSARDENACGNNIKNTQFDIQTQGVNQGNCRWFAIGIA